MGDIKSEKAPTLELPSSSKTVRVQAIDTTTRMSCDANAFVQPQIKNHERLNFKTLCFLLEHDGEFILFDCGSRKDFWNSSPQTSKMIGSHVPGLEIKSGVDEILVNQGFDLDNLKAIVWSHWHWDHVGDGSKFPASTDIVVGPGFTQNFVPGWPENPESPVLARDLEGHRIHEPDFTMNVAGFPAFDYFGDGSFYLLDVPGHAIGHICGLARTTPHTFVFMGGDCCHYAGVLRPTRYLPLPKQVSTEVLDEYYPSPCPCSVFTQHHPKATGMDARIEPFYDVSRAPGSAYSFPDLAQRSINSLQDLDAQPNIFICLAHDEVLFQVLPLFNDDKMEDINDWQKRGLKEYCRWGFLNDLPRGGEPGRKPLVVGQWRDGRQITWKGEEKGFVNIIDETSNPAEQNSMRRGRPRLHVAPCKFCHKQFKRSEHLQRHERIHTQEKPFVCRCGQSFSRRDLLTRHHRQSRQQDENQYGVIQCAEQGSPSEMTLSTNMAPSGEASRPHTPLPELQEEEAVDVMDSIPEQHIELEDRPEVDSERHPTPAETTAGLELEPSDLSATPSFLLGAADSLQAFEFLWNDFPIDDQPLPTTFLNTNLSLVDISEQHVRLPSPPPPPPPPHPPAFPQADRQLDIGSSREIPTDPNLNIPININLSQETSQTRPVVSRLPSLEPSSSSRLNALEPTASYQQYLAPGQISSSCPWRILPEVYQALAQRVASLTSTIPHPFNFPSRHTLSRYLEGYFRGFHAHMPMLHVATLTLETLGPELTLALAAVGALYRFEHAKGIELYRVAKVLINRRLDQFYEGTVSRLTGSSPGFAGFSSIPNESQHDQPSPILSQGQRGLRLLQGLLVLMAMTSWGEKALVRDALSMASQVATLVREFGIGEHEDTAMRDMSWEEWIHAEEKRRTLFVAYVLFSLQCAAFNVPPMILNQEVGLNLPSCASEWETQTALEWSDLHNRITCQPRSFQHTVERLLQGTTVHCEDGISAFGNYVLIHGIFLQIFYARNALGPVPDPESSLSEEFIKKMEAALRAWQESWEATHESTLDPSSPKGPMGFNSTALLRLVYIRLNANTGPYRQLFTRDPTVIARAFTDGKIRVCNRSPHLDRAILQCIHALSIPVRVGIAFVARTLTLNWSFQHALSNLECAFLMTYWLRSLAFCVESSGLSALRPDEQKLLDMIVALIRETELAELLDSARDHASQIRRLAACVARLWAETFKGFQVFEIVYIVGQSLSVVADTLQQE
ncbi:hypothetical protein BFJ65_g15395 [Fusarium oxysporum f. sp. cepae]|uniref:C2H2-type domain-containing protein n=1 Tax=Fusarium oxysporum f. sp. cepae TaxID=396571 RepID=A0A3L6N1C0_FUSOX|nr:hypothetical protein BFJ65_g15395 [Fusarium oxysporum f. sp. cepae]